ncbi:hypothetical protein FSARC_3374 [Fusarium sarcochroum]|uniref:Uncharacterized protein n=1 Tax=Fusarium sarcochroum TaxID=1208366 RepID=A0A8H4XBY6_9HYPO|nr:hypothetical protein FSARC_3374 [Fusarium sarcochroum]
MSWNHGRLISKAKNNTDLINSARNLIQDFRDARSELSDKFPYLVDTANVLEEIDKSIALVQQEETLHTATVIKEIKETIKKTSYISQEGARQVRVRKRDVAKRGVTVDYPNKHKNTFKPMPKWLVKRRDELNRRILCAQVGLMGNTEEGFEILRDVLLETSAKVKGVLDLDLVLATRLQNASMTGPFQPNKDFEGDEVARQDEKQNTSNCSLEAVKPEDAEEDWVFDNVTLNQARAMAGEIGVKGWTETAKVVPRGGCR